MDEQKEPNRAREAAPTKQGDDKKSAGLENVLIQEAYEHIKSKDYKEATNLFNDVLNRYGVALGDQQRSLINSELGTLYFWLGDLASATRHCEKALAYGDTNDQAYIILGRIFVARYKFPEARAYFSKISRDHPGRYFGLCLVAIKLRDTKSAESYLREVSGLVTGSDPEYRLFNAYFQLLHGNADSAVIEARALKSEVSRDPALYLLVAEIFMTAGNFGEATAVAKQVQSKCPENDHAHALLAHAAFVDEDFEKADFHAGEAVRLNQTNAYAKTVLMKIATRNGNYEIAETFGMQILNDSPDYSLGHANLGDVYFNQGRYELAEIEYEQAKEVMDSGTKGTKLREARMKFIGEDYVGAVDILRNLIQGEHTYYDDAMCDLLLCYDEMGDEEKRDDMLDKMQMRRSFYRRTEKLLQSFGEE